MDSFLDTSSLVKLYDHTESGAVALQQQLDSPGLIYLSTLAQVEFANALARKCNRGDLSIAARQALQQRFEADADNYGWVEQTASIRQLAVHLLYKHSSPQLRSLDAIQLASALAVRSSIQAFFTHDQRLADDARAEGLPVR